MHRVRAPEDNPHPAPGRGADPPAPRPTPLTLVAGAVAGEGLGSVAATVADAIGCPTVIAIVDLDSPVVAPPAALGDDALHRITGHAQAVAAGGSPPLPADIADAVPVRIGEQVVGIAAAVPTGPVTMAVADRRAWLEAAAAAASVTALIRETSEAGVAAPDAVLLSELAAGPPADIPDFLVRARHLGLELATGAVAISARAPSVAAASAVESIIRSDRGATPALIAQLRPSAVLALAPLRGGGAADPATEIAARLRSAGLTVAVSGPRRDPARLHEAVREAELLAELGVAGAEAPEPPDDTYRLLIGVLLRDRSDLAQLRDSTIAPLVAYDARHDAELIETLRAFLARDGSTTETAEAMALHRHTVGYRLSRVQEVSGLSPYESDGRERLGLGLKAHHILEAERQLEEAAPLRQ